MLFSLSPDYDLSVKGVVDKSDKVPVAFGWGQEGGTSINIIL